jgi:hypothetical protein
MRLELIGLASPISCCEISCEQASASKQAIKASTPSLLHSTPSLPATLATVTSPQPQHSQQWHTLEVSVHSSSSSLSYSSPASRDGLSTLTFALEDSAFLHQHCPLITLFKTPNDTVRLVQLQEELLGGSMTRFARSRIAIIGQREERTKSH